jgi:hypothetical protein
MNYKEASQPQPFNYVKLINTLIYSFYTPSVNLSLVATELKLALITSVDVTVTVTVTVLSHPAVPLSRPVTSTSASAPFLATPPPPIVPSRSRSFQTPSSKYSASDFQPWMFILSSQFSSGSGAGVLLHSIIIIIIPPVPCAVLIAMTHSLDKVHRIIIISNKGGHLAFSGISGLIRIKLSR